jgi:2-dehydropantoate 2-reductase
MSRHIRVTHDPPHHNATYASGAGQNAANSYDSGVRVIIYGAGAVGSVIGGRLRQGGADVVLVGRQAHVDAIRERGLALRTATGTGVVSVEAVTTIAALAPTTADVVMITAKTQDCTAVHDQLLAWNPDVAVVCATNGVEHERMALRRFAHVYAMVVQLPAQFEHPGEVTALWGPINAILDVGCYPSGVDALACELAALVDGSPGLTSETDDDVMIKKHAKLLLNLGNTADAACGYPGRGARSVAAAVAEGRDVYAAAGVRWQQSPERAARYKERAATMQLDAPEGDTFLGGSTWQSIVKGAPSIETDYFNGEIVMLGRLHGVPTPTNDFMQGFANHMLRDQIPAGSLSVDDFDAAWQRSLAS